MAVRVATGWPRRERGCRGCPVRHGCPVPHLEEQLVFGDPLDWLQQVGVQTQLVVQFLLAFLKPRTSHLDSFHYSLFESQLVKEIKL